MGEMFDLIGARPAPLETEGEARPLQLAIRTCALSLGFASIFGAAVGCTDPGLAATNLVKLPMIVALGLGCALPTGLLAWKALGSQLRLGGFAMCIATGTFTATLVLAAAAPLVALYSLTTQFFGAPLVMLTAVVGVVCGVGNALRSALYRADPAHRVQAVVPVGAMLTVLLAALFQLTYLASPILPQDTLFDHGADGLLRP